MALFLSSDTNPLPVVDAVSLIAQHIVDGDPQPGLAGDGGWQVVSDPHTRPASNIALVEQERWWSRCLQVAMVRGDLALYDANGFRREYHVDVPVSAMYVKAAQLAQWLVDVYGKDVVLDGVPIEPTPAPGEREVLKRELLVQKLIGEWPTIVADLQEGSRNGLMKAAGLGDGLYDVERACQWARQRGKFYSGWAVDEPTPLTDLPTRVHRCR